MKIYRKYSQGILLGFIVHQSFSQGMVNNAQLFIKDKTIVTINTDLSNNDSLINYGDISISGNLINSTKYKENNSSSVALTGKKIQNIDSKSSFNKLVINGEGEKKILSNLTINNYIKFENGLVTPIDTNVRLLIKQDASIDGGSTISYVNGKLFWEGVDDQFYPIGINGHYRPLYLDNISGSANLVQGFEVVEPNPDTKPGLGTETVSGVRYWKRNLSSGTYKEGKLTLTVADNDEPFSDISMISIGEAQSLTGAFRSIGASKFKGTLANGFVVSDKVAIGNYFALIGPLGIDKRELYFMPNALAPAAPNVDDQVIKFFSRDVTSKNFYLRIFNKQGNIVFESLSFEFMNTTGWDGKNISTGKEEDSGVYDYQLGGEYVNGREFRKNGTITLIR